MCLIIVKPAGKILTKRQLHNGFLENPDGVGFMFSANNVLIIRKFTYFREFYKAFRKCEEENPQSDFAIHFRLATSGNKNFNMIHPFVINDIGFMHNGILWEYSYKDSLLSDTALFCRNVIAKLLDNWLSSEGIIKLLESYAEENNSKFVIMNAEKYVIINEKAGEWRKNGCWFSNKEITSIVGFSKYTDNQYGFSEDFDNDGLDDYRPIKTYSFIVCEICQRNTLAKNIKYMEGALLCPECREEFEDNRLLGTV